MSTDAASASSASIPLPFVPAIKINSRNTNYNFQSTFSPNLHEKGRHSNYQEAELSLDEYIQNNKKKPPLRLKTRILQILVRRKIQAAANQNYSEASKLSKIEEQLKSYFGEIKERDRQYKRTHYGISSSEQLRTRLNQINNEYDKKIQTYKLSREKIMEQLYQDQQREIAEFGNKWNNPNSFLDLAKPSSHLLQLRDIERKKVLLMDYEGAQQTKVLADQLEKEETKASQQKAVTTMKMQLKQLEVKHQNEIAAAQNTTQRGLEHLLQEKASIVDPLEKALKKSEKTENSKPETKRPSSRMNPNSPIENPSYNTYSNLSTIQSPHIQSSRAPSPVAFDEFEDVDLATPRTFRKMYDMRSSTNVKRLDLDGIDITQYLKPRKQAALPRERSRTSLSSTHGESNKSPPSSRKTSGSSSSFRRAKSIQRSSSKK